MPRKEFEFNIGEEEIGELGVEKAAGDSPKKPEDWETDEEEEGLAEPEEDFSKDFLPVEEDE